MVVFTVMVMNKAGSLLFVQDYAEIPKVRAVRRGWGVMVVVVVML